MISPRKIDAFLKENNMKQQKAFSASVIALLAVMTAITVIFTLAVRIPMGPTKGYLSLADVAVYFASFAFGPLVGGFSAGVGTGLADVLGGYAIPWAPISFLVHGLQGLVAGWFCRKGSFPMMLLGWFLGSLIMVGGYFIAAAFLYGTGTALTEVLGNIGQVSAGGFGGMLLYYAVRKAFPAIKDLAKPKEWEEE
jgi:uncharacterized membrane protein